MRYPTLSKARLEELAIERLREEDDTFPEPEWQGAGEEFDLADFAEAATELQRQWSELLESDGTIDKDAFEGKVGAGLHAMLGDLPIDVLDDPGFWRYLGYRYFWWFVAWREANAFQKQDYGACQKYIDGNNPSECVLLRAFLRGQICLENGSYALAAAIPKATDFWRSHVIRVRTSTAPVLAREFAREQETTRMSTDVLRPYARRLNRVWTNVVLHSYDRAQAEALIKELRTPTD